MSQHQPPPPGELEEDEEASVAVATGSPTEISAAVEETKVDDENNEEADDLSSDDEEFEFALVTDDPDIISADEVFFNGKIRPVYPVFGRDLFLFRPGDDNRDRSRSPWSRGGEEKEEKAVRMPLKKLMLDEERDTVPSVSSCSSSECDELERLPAESYCVWTPGSVPPSPEMKNKSKSTGSSSRRWRLRDLVVRRSHSDGKKKFFFLTSNSSQSESREHRKIAEDAKPVEERQRRREGKEKKGRGSSEIDVVSAHRLYYPVKGGEVPADQRRSFLPYRKDLVGIFASVNGTSRGFHPF